MCLVNLGAAGEPCLRYLSSALGQPRARLLPHDVGVIAVDRDEIAVDAFPARVAEALDRDATGLKTSAAATLRGALGHRVADVAPPLRGY